MRSRMHLAATEAEDFITNSEDNDNYMYGDHTNEQVVQVNEKVMCRSRFVIFMNSGPQSKANKRARDRAVSRIPTTVLKRVMQKRKKVRTTLQKHFQKSVPKSSRLHKYFNRKSIVYWRLTNEWCVNTNVKHTRMKTNYNQSKGYCLNKQQSWFYLVFVRLRSPKHKKVPVACFRSNSYGLQKLKCSHMQTLWVSCRFISLSGDIAENPGPFNQCHDNVNAACSSRANPVSLLELRLSEMGRSALDTGGGGNCFFRAVSHQLYGTPNNHFYIRTLGIQYLVHNPEMFIESNTEHSWQAYLSNMSRQGTWADGIIIQAVANSLNLTINIAESNATFSPVTVICPVNNEGESVNIYIGHIGETHYVSTVLTSQDHNTENYNVNWIEYNSEKQNILENAQVHVDTSKLEKRKASKRKYIQKKRANEAYREMENRKRAKILVGNNNNNEHRSKAEKRKASKREHMQKKRASEAYREMENRKQPKILVDDNDTVHKVKAEKRKAAKREHMQRKRANAANKKTENKMSETETNGKAHTTKTVKLLDTDDHETIVDTECIFNRFHDNIRCGPEYICTCCDQLWYRSSVIKCYASNYSNCEHTIVQSCITGLRSVHDTEWICNTCHSNLKEGKLPQCSKANNMSFPEKPEVLDLTPLEERLISPRIPFMQIRELPRGGQLSIHGNIVNVPSDVNSTVHSLPRPISESQTIPIKLKRRLSYKHHYQFQNVRPMKVLEAARFLVNTSDLYKNEGIEVQDTWQNSITVQSSENEEWNEFFRDNGNFSEKNNEDTANRKDCAFADETNTEHNSLSSENNETDDWCEVEERPSGVTDTLLQQPDIINNNIISFAPGEGNKPLGIFMDKDSEFLSFPTIFCGKRRANSKERKVPVSYSTVAKWELRCQDRRAAQSVPNIFYKLKKIQIKQIQDTACIALRKCKTKGKKYTAGELKNENCINKLVHLDEGFRVLKNVRGSPAYFQRCKKDLFAMIRQIGNPTWFCSFSAAETRWTHLLKALGKIVEKKEYTDDDIKNMTWQQKSNLIQKDPITCARNFDHMVQLFIRDVLKSDLLPIGEIADYFYRVEFQQRGSPHIHGLFWVKGAPQYDKSPDEEVISFVDKYVTCQKAETSDMEDLVNLQMHRHAKTCKKMGHKVCRFNFPLPPMQRTMILKPLEEENTFDDEKKKNIKQNAEKIKEQLESMKYGEDISFLQFLDRLKLTEESYILALRHGLKRSTLFLKRLPSEIRINNYNTHLLKTWQANMDMQYVLDPYACATYILSYITKGQRGMSRLLEKAADEAKCGNTDISNKVRHIGNKFLNAVEISAQEAAYLVLQIPMRRSTREFQFINTSHPDERTFLLKKLDKLKELPDNSPDIESDNLIKRYQRRPKMLENLCLAEFAAWFNCVRDKHADAATDETTVTGPDNFVPETYLEDNTDDDPHNVNETNEQQSESNEYQLHGGMKLVKRRKSKIIRSVRFYKDKDPENYFREQLMLYAPWRKENTDLVRDCKSYQERFEQLKQTILCNRYHYEYHSEILDKAMKDLNNDECDDMCSNVAPNAEHANEQDGAIKEKPSELLACFDPGDNKQHSQYDLLDDIGIFPRCNDQEDLVVKRISDDEYRKLVRSLNEKQRQFFYHVLHSIKTTEYPLRLFLSGGAGVGKSTVTNALYEALIRYLNGIAGENPDDLKVVKAAPTGKAAFNIKGNTLHAAFKIPANKGFEYCALDNDRLNTIRTKLRKLRVLFIDEISMVGSGMFNFLNLRLQQIMGTKEPFGGISVITVGDLFQLKPVFDRWIFENPNTCYSDLASNLWKDFTLFELTEIMRQKDDRHFAELLNRLREGKHSEGDIESLKLRLMHIKPEEGDYPMNTTHLFTTNASVDQHNNNLYDLSRSNKAQVKAIDIVVGDISDDLKKQMKGKIPNDPTKTMGLYSLASLATDGKYDLTTNIDVTDGLTNGTECLIKSIDYRVNNSSRPSIIWVSFPDLDIGKKQRRENLNLYAKRNIHRSWTPILEVTRQFRINRKTQVQILRRQFPLRPATAKTIHRCQGDTLDAAVVDFPSSTREHMHYVGLSRVRNLSSLHILNLNEQKIRVSEKVANEMNRLRTEASLLPLVTLKTVDSSLTKTIIFHNVRSLHLHIDDVRNDYNIQKADLNIFVETRLCASDISDFYSLGGFKLHRNDYHNSYTRSSYGSAMYVKNDLCCTELPYRFNFNEVEITITVINKPISNLHVIGIYRSKTKVEISKFIDALNHLYNMKITNPEKPTVLLGDFNVNLLEDNCDKKILTRCLLQERGYTQLIKQYTTDNRTLIDHIYTNVPHLVQSAGVLESYYSDHKPVFISLTTQ